MFTNGESGELQTCNQISLYFENFRMITINIFNHAALHVPGAVIAQVQYDLKKDTMRMQPRTITLQNLDTVFREVYRNWYQRVSYNRKPFYAYANTERGVLTLFKKNQKLYLFIF